VIPVKLKCFFGYHKDCAKHYKHEGSKVHVYCKDSQRYLFTEPIDDSDSKVIYDKEKETKQGTNND